MGVGLEPPDCKVVVPASNMRTKRMQRWQRKGAGPASAAKTRKGAPGERKHCCTVCNKRFRDAACLSKHMSFVHKGMPLQGGKLPSTSVPGPAIVRTVRKGMDTPSRALGEPASLHRSRGVARRSRGDRPGRGMDAPEKGFGRTPDASPISSDDAAGPNPAPQKSADTPPSRGPRETQSQKQSKSATCVLDLKVLAPALPHNHEAWNSLLPALSVVQIRSIRTKGPAQTASDLDRLSSWEAQPPTGSSNTARVEDGWVDKQLAGMLGTGITQSAFIHAIGGSSLAVLKTLLESTHASAAIDWVQVLLARPGKEIGTGCCHSIVRTTPLDFAVQIGRVEAVRVLLEAILCNRAASPAAEPQGGLDNSEKEGPSSGAGAYGG